MCEVTDEIVDPGDWEPGREHMGKVERFIRNVKWAAAIVIIPGLIWMGRVEGFVQKGDRQTALMSHEQHQDLRNEFQETIEELPPAIYRNYVDREFQRLHERLDFFEGLLLTKLAEK